MKIAWFCGGYPPDRKGGVPSIMQQAREGLEARGHEVTVIAPCFGTRLSEPGVVQFDLPLPHVHENVHYGLWCLKTWVFLRRHEGEFDVYCGHLLWGFLACLVGKLFWPRQKWVMVPHVAAEVYAGWLDSFAHKANYWISRQAFARADRVLAISDFMKTDLEKNFPSTKEKITRVYYGVETNVFCRKPGPKAGPAGPRAGRKTVLYLARLRAQKGVEDSIKAFTWMKRQGLGGDAELVVAGGCSPAYFEYLTRTYPGTRFLGSLSREEAIEQYNQADLYIIPSESESFCLTLVEAMACELPVLCSDLPIFREITQNKAFFVPYGQPEKLGAKLAEVLQRGDLREIGRAMRKVALRYSVENNVSGYEAVLRELAEGNKGSGGKR